MEAQVKWVDGLTFIGQSPSGHSIVMDGNGGATAPSPMEMVLMAAGGCSSVDVINGLKQAQQEVYGCHVTLSTERRANAPRLFTQINLHFVVSGINIEPKEVERVVADSLEKYCSVCLMLGESVKLTHSWEITEE
ncbi:OsmC family protein [Vibrio cincinnatiensis]|uniref:Putative redox protein n=1 Tax=Vibrio cincinnatiensis DSM 19608 TaxID=1123491 RepID=A0A1T4P034_VIBCI|nr:OsmC family protein [Vibrio cincinnatiensis]MCG3723473.1 OsmC family protein [Vibrio cincinnatiensis]MCG3726660.1 OsmC family protein [Vibrio cincinnatiensis]MCG3760471.1 OsmC family protein [Vibrio cincinnatiensis]MCG3763780.1 OsmC family protein [Vibrio cincinnatiensis]MCG3765423.1 OsmC family protein [Vibrio cincinnatiensis]